MLDVTFDRPFGFLARHRPTGLVLLAGWVADPDPWPEDGGYRPEYEEAPAPSWDDAPPPPPAPLQPPPPPPTTGPAPAPADRGPLNALRRALGRRRSDP
ncbi:hypothetical protein GCM10010182_38300 [Actinomadura cremea]|nr:hypothetical protein GCM10010182_38300 [Actinomadura cremea]